LFTRSRSSGCREALILPHGLPTALLDELVGKGFAAATPGRLMAGARALDVTLMQIIDAGRKALPGTG
jgi:hypothetical protein